MENIKKKVYFTYQDILDFLDYDGHPQFPNDKNMHQAWFTEMLDDSPFEFAVYTLSEFFPDSLINVLNNTLPRYCPLLQQNEIYSTDPVAPIGSKTTGRTRFNDTPQDEGEYNDEEHASNVSKSISETEVDSGSIMERLNEMFKNFRSIILEWSNEFNQIFLKEEQII